MKVRVFEPADGSNEQYESSEYHFDTLPLEGQFLRLFTPEPGDYPIERVGFIQEEPYFVAAVWLARPPVEAWISHQEEIDEAAENDRNRELNDNGRGAVTGYAFPAAESDKPSRPEAMRRLVARGLGSAA